MHTSATEKTNSRLPPTDAHRHPDNIRDVFWISPGTYGGPTLILLMWNLSQLLPSGRLCQLTFKLLMKAPEIRYLCSKVNLPVFSSSFLNRTMGILVKYNPQHKLNDRTFPLIYIPVISNNKLGSLYGYDNSLKEIHMIKTVTVQSWSAVKRAGFSSTGPEFNVQHPHHSLQ